MGLVRIGAGTRRPRSRPPESARERRDAIGARVRVVTETHDVLVIGGGPAGSTAAALLAKAGVDVCVLEAGRHPRVHVGESLLPGIVPILSEMDALTAVESAGFGRKSGTTHWQWGQTPAWDLWFADTDQFDHAWLVERARFDEILFDAALRAGARCEQHAAVKELAWGGDRLVGARYRRRAESEDRDVRARLVIDASGQTALVARALALRETIDGLCHRAAWAHFERAGRLPPPRENQALFVAEDRHWLWLFPFPEGRASVGVISLDDAIDDERSRAERFDDAVEKSDAFRRVLGAEARRVTPVRAERDWSYRMQRVVGPGFLLVGDASGFIDPVLSTGVFLAMHAARHAARTAIAVLKDGAPEAPALAAYQAHHRELFGDLLRMVRFYYQQNLHKEDYFWESKRILLRDDTELRPQKAFLILTSGLVRNLALEDVALREQNRRAAVVRDGGEPIDPGRPPPTTLGFVCVHLRRVDVEPPAQLYLLIEPKNPGAPSLFRTAHFDINCLAPRYDNDPIREPALEPTLRHLGVALRQLDDLPEESLAQFWARRRSDVARLLARLPPGLECARVFGE